jgi:hypothetical protein
MAWFTTAAPKVSMIMEQHDETRFHECASESFDAVESGCAKPMRHRHGGKGFGSVGWSKQPSCQLRAIGCGKLYVNPVDHYHGSSFNGH